MIALAALLVNTKKHLLEGVQVLSEDDWDLRFGWAAAHRLLEGRGSSGKLLLIP